MEKSPHVMIAGPGADVFAARTGLEQEEPSYFFTESRWQSLVKQLTKEGKPVPPRPAGVPPAGSTVPVAQLEESPDSQVHGTVGVVALDRQRNVAAGTSTGGLQGKMPGRVGDSPIIGAGLYVDNEIGAAGSTGRGEANLYGLCSFLIVDEMRRGAHPKDAGMTALKRIQSNTIDKRLLNPRGLPNFDINFYVLNKKGEYAAVSMYGTPNFAVCDDKGPRLEKMEALLPGRSNA
jgi:isoaspartyl peptidase/L-asparaginase-like protein (Ntn-hydrolase superfamily)